MAQELARSPEIERLIRIGEASRSRLTQDVAALRHKLDVPGRVRDSLRSHPSGWIGGSALAGFAASLFLRRKSKRRSVAEERRKARRRGMGALALGLAGSAIRPVAKFWLAAQLKKFVANPGPLRGLSFFTTQTTTNPTLPSERHVRTPGSRPR